MPAIDALFLLGDDGFLLGCPLKLQTRHSAKSPTFLTWIGIRINKVQFGPWI